MSAPQPATSASESPAEVGKLPAPDGAATSKGGNASSEDEGVGDMALNSSVDQEADDAFASSPRSRKRGSKSKSPRVGSVIMRGGQLGVDGPAGPKDEFMERRRALESEGASSPPSELDRKEVWRTRLRAATQSKAYTIVFVLATIFALFIGDVKVLALPKSADEGVEITLSICLILFLVEIAVLSFVEEGYFGGTFFYLDIVAGVSLIFDISFIFPAETETTSLTVARAGRAARIGSRAGRVGRILRIVRLMRMLRMFRLFKFFFRKKKRVVNPLGNNVKVEVPNQLSRSSTEIVSRRVVVLVLVVMLVVTLLQFFEADLSAQAALQGIIAFNATVVTSSALSAQQPGYKAAYDTSVSTYRDLFQDELLFFRVFGDVVVNKEDTLDKRRASEIQTFVSEETDTKATLDRLHVAKEESAYNLGIIGCIVVILLTASFVFSRDSHKLIGKPVRDMISAREVSEGLLRVFKVVTNTESSSEIILSTIVETLCHVISASRVTLFLIDKTNNEVWCQVSASILDTTTSSKVPSVIRHREQAVTHLMDKLRLPLEDELVGACARTGETMLINEVVPSSSMFDASSLFRRMQGQRDEDRGTQISPISPQAKSAQVAPEAMHYASPNSTHGPEATSRTSSARASMLRKETGGSVRQLDLENDDVQFDPDQEIWRTNFRLPKAQRYKAYLQYNVSTLMCMRVNDRSMAGQGLAVLQVINKIGDGKDTMFTENDQSVLETFSAQIATIIKSSSLDAAFTNAVERDTAGALPNLLAQYTTASLSKPRESSAEGRNQRVGGSRARLASMPPRPRGLPPLDERRGSSSSFVPGSVIRSQEDFAEDTGRQSPTGDAPEDAPGSGMQQGGPKPRQREGSYAPIPWRAIVSEEVLGTWEFDPLAFHLGELPSIAVAIMEQLDVLERFRVRPLKARMFAERILGGYHDVPYHNAFHAISVLHVSYMVLTNTTARTSLRSIDVFALAIAALGHDNGHRGMNNGFHAATLREDKLIPELALTYNDQSVLENLHARNTFSVLIQPEFDISSRLTPDTKKVLRKSIIGGILATDMTHHFALTKDLAAKSSFDVAKDEDRQMLLNAIVHSADLANPILPPQRSVDLTLRVTQEFQNQAQTERELGLPVSTFMDIKGPVTRNNVGVAKNETGFTEFVVMPLWRAMHEFFPELKVCIDHAQQNLDFWRHVSKTGKVYDENGNEVDPKKLEAGEAKGK